MKEGQPHYKPNVLRHMDNQSHLHNTIAEHKYWINGQAQVPLTQEQRKQKRLRKK